MALPGQSAEYYKDLGFWSDWYSAMNPGQMPPMGGGNLSDPAFLAWKQQQGIPARTDPGFLTHGGGTPPPDLRRPEPILPAPAAPVADVEHLYDTAGTRHDAQPGWTNSTVASYLADGTLTPEESAGIQGLLEASSDEGKAAIMGTFGAFDPQLRSNFEDQTAAREPPVAMPPEPDVRRPDFIEEREPRQEPIYDNALKFMEPLEGAQAEFAATGQVSPERQIAAFQQASQQGMTGTEMEALFGMPAGTARRFASENQLAPLPDARGGMEQRGTPTTPIPANPNTGIAAAGGIGTLEGTGSEYLDPALAGPASLEEYNQIQAGGTKILTNPTTGGTMEVLANDPRLAGMSDAQQAALVFGDGTAQGGIQTLPQTGTATIGDGTGFQPETFTTYQDPVTGVISHQNPATTSALQRAQAEFETTGQVTPQLQLQAFQEASQQGMTGAQLENMFGMPAGTSAQFAQANQLTPLTTAPAATGIATTAAAGTPAAGTPAAAPGSMVEMFERYRDGTATLSDIATQYGWTEDNARSIINTWANLPTTQGGLGTIGGGYVAGDDGVSTTEGTGTAAQSGTVTIGADGQQVFTDGQIDTIGTVNGGTTTGGTTTGGTTTTTGGTPAAGTGTGTLASLIDTFKSTGTLGPAQLNSLIDMARAQGVSANELANMAGVTVADVRQGLQNQGYAADYLAAGTQRTLGTGTPTVTTPSDATTTITRESPEIEARKLGVIDLAKQLASQEPAGGLPPSQVAGLSPLERSAYQATVDSFGGFLPAVQQGYSTVGKGLQALTDLYGNRIPTSDATIRGAVQGYDPFVREGIGQLGEARKLVQDVGAGAQPYLQQSGQLVRDVVGPQGAQPYLKESGQYGRGAAGFGIGTYADAMRGARGATGRGYRAGDIGLASAASGMRQLAGTGDQYDPYSTMSYMNPYEQQVIDAAMGDIRREGNKQLMAQRAQAVQAGAFGGSRGALAESELNRNIMEQQAKTSANLRAQGYTQAQANSMASFEASQRRRQQGAQLMGSLGTQGAATSLQAAQQGQTGAIQGGQLGGQTAGGIRDTGALLGNLGTSYGQLGLQGAQQLGNLGTGYGQLGLQGAETLGRQAGMVGQLGESRANLGLRGVQQYGDVTKQGVAMADLARQYGLNQAELGQVGQGMNIRDIAALEAAGGRLRGQQQTELDVARQNKLQDIYEPYQRIGFMSDVLRGAPSTQMQLTKNYTQQPSRAAQAIGGVGSLVATAAGAKQANII